ncbi:MAG: hypothetical protein M1834_000319 [Cirrosporium novae-zelandiae]|nr:MAG: hypothetical protein M1834_000319 [Cirrosporium novae-zelandiae]
MSTAVASAAPAPLTQRHIDRDPSPKSYQALAPSVPHPDRSSVSSVSVPPSNPVTNAASAAVDSAAPVTTVTTPDGKRSPNSTRSGPTPKIIVKKEPPASPSMLGNNSRHRPRKLDLSTNIPTTQGAMSARPSAGGLAMHEVGLACLSPGFQTQDPAMREQLQRSISVRDQQRSIIEARLQKSAKPGEGGDGPKTTEGSTNPFSGAKTAGLSKKRPPPGLSIVPPSHEQFANERVIQSAPLNQTFTGRHQPQPLTRHVVNQSSNLSGTSHIHHVPATQTNNRLPPLSDVFGSESLNAHREPNRNSLYPSHSSSNSSHSNTRPAFPSPGFPPPHSQAPLSARPREYRSAEEAVHEMSGGREDLLPKIIHYPGNHSPSSPPNGQVNTQYASVRSNSRRRTRAEYEGSSPPLGNGPEPRRAPFSDRRESPETERRKKEEFMSLMSRAWDIMRS